MEKLRTLKISEEKTNKTNIREFTGLLRENGYQYHERHSARSSSDIYYEIAHGIGDPERRSITLVKPNVAQVSIHKQADERRKEYDIWITDLATFNSFPISTENGELLIEKKYIKEIARIKYILFGPQKTKSRRLKIKDSPVESTSINKRDFPFRKILKIFSG